MSGSVLQEITNLEIDIANLSVQLVQDAITDPSAVPGIQDQINADNQEILQLLEGLCVAHGTHILTDRGEVAVENLTVGDLVVTPRGPTETMPVRWIGHQHFAGDAARFAQPVLVRAGALGDGLPLRDLRLSGDHCLHLDGRLVPVKLLINGCTIVAEKGNKVVDYVNIELDRHSVVLAEGVESETYLDCGNRQRFDNANEGSDWLASRTAGSDAAWHDGTAFAPPLWSGPELVALTRRLASSVEQSLAA